VPAPADEVFDALIERMIKDYLKFNPVAGTWLGLHEYDNLVPDLSRDNMLRMIAKVKRYLKKLSELNPNELTGGRALDYKIIVSSLKEILVISEEWPLWRMVPQGLEAVGSLIFPVLIRDYLPVEHKVVALTARLRSLDKVVTASIEAVDEPYKLWVSYALMVGKGLPSLLAPLVELGKSTGYTELVDAVGKAEEIIEKGMGKVQDLMGKAREGFKPIGKELFEKLLKLRFIDEDPETLRRLGYEEAEKYKGLMLEAVKGMGLKSIEEGLAKIKEAHPKSRDEVFEIYKRALKELRKFIVEKDIVEPPPLENVAIVETPDFLRPVTPFAGYIPPAMFSWSLRGVMLVTPPATDEMLKHFNIYDIYNTVVHEVYPGHHVQQVHTKLNPDVFRKIFAGAIETIEGWAHYTEELVIEKGFMNTPEYRLKVYHDALWRAVRVYVDVELSTGMITFEQAVEKLIKDAYLPKEAAYSEALRYTMNPGYQLCYNYGKRKIKELREKAKKILGNAYKDSIFHKALLEEGSLPIKLLEDLVIKKLSSMVK